MIQKKQRKNHNQKTKVKKYQLKKLLKDFKKGNSWQTMSEILK